MKGFTLVEVVVIFVICAILAAVAIPMLIDYKNGTKTEIVKVHRPMLNSEYEVQCINGYKFIIKYNVCTQIIDAEGHGILCNEGE